MYVMHTDLVNANYPCPYCPMDPDTMDEPANIRSWKRADSTINVLLGRK